jgi:hypothetical protein
MAPQRNTARFSRGTAINTSAITSGQANMYVNGDILE